VLLRQQRTTHDIKQAIQMIGHVLTGCALDISLADGWRAAGGKVKCGLHRLGSLSYTLLCLKTAVLLAQKLLFSKQPQFRTMDTPASFRIVLSYPAICQLPIIGIPGSPKMGEMRIAVT
jgi:hypothetical protein